LADQNDQLLQLAPFVMGRVKRGVVGTSRYARKLRLAIHDAAHDPEQRPVLISGEPGLGKDNITALIHYGSHQRRQLLIRFEPTDLQSIGVALLDNLGDHSVLINNVDQIEAPLRQRLIAMAQGEVETFRGRILFTSESCQADRDGPG
jgi:Holliday junction resolvasome RuvABC ATP-dependent DNA helicase subunit